MKNLFIQHEILLVTNTSYYKKHLIEPHGNADDTGISQARELEKACWNGFIDHLLSGVMEGNLVATGLTLMHTRPGKAILKIELASYSVALEKCRSIDSVFFLTAVNAN